MPTPSSYKVTPKVLPPRPKLLVEQPSLPNSGTLSQRTRKALTLAKPSACTGKLIGLTARAFGFKSAQAGAIFGKPDRKSTTFGVLLVSPPPNVTLPLEFRDKPFQTQPAVPTGPPKTNSKPPDKGPVNAGDPAPLSSSPRNGVF